LLVTRSPNIRLEGKVLNSRAAPIEMKPGNTENESEGSAAARLVLHNGDVEGKTGRKS